MVANPEHLEKLNQGVEAWNEWRLRHNILADPADLSEAELSGKDLRKIFLSGTNLRGAHLERADLSGAVFGVSGEGANLQGTHLREAILRGCNLSSVTGGLQSKQLAGADLTGATLPGPLADLFKELKAVGDISESARKLFIAMLAACLYLWLTIATTTDVNLITNRASSPLPIIQTSIPIVGFYVVAPLLLLCVYFYFHFYLQKLWEELGSLPGIFPDGRRLHEMSDPWLLNDLVRSHVAMLRPGRPFMSYFQQAISIVLAWWLVPITLFLFWGRYLPRRDFRWTTLQVALLAISIVGAVSLYHLAASTLRGAERRSFSWPVLKKPRTYAAVGSFIAAGTAFMLLSVGAIRGVQNKPDYWWKQNSSHWSRRYTWVPRAMALVHYSPFANFGQADVSVKPPNWTGKNESEMDLVRGAQLTGTDLRCADAPGAFLAKANLEGAWLEGAQLNQTDLREVNLDDAFLTGAKLRFAHLNKAQLILADLTGADLTGADLTGAILARADLTRASLTGANLAVAHLTGVNLARADLTLADFRSSSNSTSSSMEPRLLGAIAAATLIADLKIGGPTVAQLKAAENWDKAYYDDDLLEQLGLPADHNQKLAEEQKREEQQNGQPAEKAPASTPRQSGAGKDKSAKAP